VCGAVFLGYHLFFDYSVMTSPSMSPALQGACYQFGDRILSEKWTVHLRAPRRWEIYAYHDDENQPVMKRVVGLPGERITIRDHQVWINGRPISRPAELAPVRYHAFGNLANGQEVECHDGYYMLGDASADSQDSRFTGVVNGDRLEARPWLILGPSDRFGWVR
jgi:signal peptidase I